MGFVETGCLHAQKRETHTRCYNPAACYIRCWFRKRQRHTPPSAPRSFPFVHSTEKPAGAPVAPALIVNVMDPGVELKHNTVNGANGGLILPLLSCVGLDWPAA